jgi:hypothetical protein
MLTVTSRVAVALLLSAGLTVSLWGAERQTPRSQKGRKGTPVRMVSSQDTAKGQNGDQGDQQNGQNGDQGEKQNGQTGEQGEKQNSQAGDQGEKQNGQSDDQGDRKDGKSPAEK